MLAKSNIKSPGHERIWQWIHQTIAQPLEANNGFAICPFIKKYINRIQLVQGFEGVETGCAILNSTELEAIVYFDTVGKGIERRVKRLNKTYNPLNVEVLYMDPTTSEPPITTVPDYTWREHYIIVVQRRDTLHRARTQLRRTRYYDTWDDFALLPPNQ